MERARSVLVAFELDWRGAWTAKRMRTNGAQKKWRAPLFELEIPRKITGAA
jgi:hypothetical protein